MIAHCVAPQQSFMMATLLLVMDGLLGGGSGVSFFTFGGPEKIQGGRLYIRKCLIVIVKLVSQFNHSHKVFTHCVNLCIFTFSTHKSEFLLQKR